LFYKLRTHYDGCTLLRSYNHLRSALRAKSNPGPSHTIVCTGCRNGKGVKGLVRPAARRARTRPLDALGVTQCFRLLGRRGFNACPAATRRAPPEGRRRRFSCFCVQTAVYRKTACISATCKTIPCKGIESPILAQNRVRSWRGAPTTAAPRQLRSASRCPRCHATAAWWLWAVFAFHAKGACRCVPWITPRELPTARTSPP